jgi:hypothetical protein
VIKIIDHLKSVIGLMRLSSEIHKDDKEELHMSAIEFSGGIHKHDI